MPKIICQFINGAVSDTSRLETGYTSDWRLRIVELEDGASSINEGRELFQSPICRTKEECQEYKRKFNEERLKKDA
jgi:hypothetical protein